MEQILKIQSEQGFAETAKPTEFINSKLIDIIVPGNMGAFDFSKSYININMECVNAPNANEPASAVASDKALYNNEIVYNGNLGNANPSTIVPCSALVRNADMFSANKGMVESIRRVNTLRQVLWNFENDKAEQHDGLDKIGTFQGRRGLNNRTSSLLQIIGSNVNVAGVADVTKKAHALSRDYRIPLSDLFGVGNAMWNSDVYGDTRIHLEIQPNLLSIAQLGGSEFTSTFDPTGVNLPFGKGLDYDAGSGLGNLPAGATLGKADAPIVLAIPYFDPQLDCPFYVGQAVKCSATGATTGGSGDVFSVIDSIEFFGATNSTNPPAGDQRCRIVLRDTILTGAGGGEAVTLVRIEALLSATADDQIRINRAEIVLTQMPGVDAPSSIDYRTYSTEETQGNGNTSYNKQVIVEPNCQNLIIAHCDSGKTAPQRSWKSYRLAINNEDVAGNRDIAFKKPLHEDRVLRFMNNRGQNISNISFNTVGTSETQGANNQVEYYPILETMPITPDDKLVNLELNSAGAQDVVFFKELVRSI